MVAVIPTPRPAPGRGDIAAALQRAAVFEVLNDAVLVTDLAGVVVDCNPAAQAMFGLPRAALLGSLPGAHNNPAEARTRFRRVLETVRREGRWSADIPFLRGGQPRLCACNVVGLYGPDGDLVGTAGISRDVTEERAMSGHLAATELRWRLTLDGAPGGIALVQLDGQFLRVNAALAAIVGRTVEGLLTMSFQDVTHPDDLESDLQMVAALIAGELETVTGDKRFVRPDGTTVWVTRSVGLVSDPDTGEPVHFVTQVQDISERRVAAHRLRSIVAGATDAFIAADIQGRVTDWNESAVGMFGWTREQSLGRPLTDLIVPAAARAGHQAGLTRLAAGGQARVLNQRTRLEACRRDGSLLPVELTVWRVPEGQEYYAFVRDISDRVAAEEVARLAAERQAAVIAAQLAVAAVELTPEKVMQKICDRALELTGATGAVIELREGEALVYRAVAGSAGPHLGLRLPVATSLSGLAVTRGEALVCTDAETDPRVNAPACRAIGVRSMICAPLRHHGTAIGVLKVLSDQPEAFRHDDLLALELLAAPFGAAVANAWRLDATLTQATTDPLTGLANRHHIREVLARALRPGDDGLVAVAFLDLDDFKAVNDTWGHAVGDDVLREVGRRIRRIVRSSDAAARFGGDEFVIVCEELSEPLEAERLTRRLRDAIAGPYPVPGGTATVGVSIGVALTSRAGELDAVLEAADGAMYRAKKQGGNAVVFTG